jgi:predicted DNA-binding transcriptional regulator YafY
VADTSRRALQLLSLLGARPRWQVAELAERLGVSARTVRRDVETLRALDYPVITVHGPDGGYQLGTGRTLPPLQLDEEQAFAVAVALQTAPSTVFGLADDAARALETLLQVLPPRLREAAEAVRLTRLQNYWEFPAPPIDAAALTAVGSAVRRRHVLVVETLRADGSRAAPADPDFAPALRIEPHHLVVWAARWYLVGFDPAGSTWSVRRVDRLRVRPTTHRFAARRVPGGDVGRFVMTSPDRGDTPAAWQCTGSARLDLPAEVVARWAPGGSVVEGLAAGGCRLTVGAWSWAGIAGILATFDATLSDVEPPELVEAGRVMAGRWA